MATAMALSPSMEEHNLAPELVRYIHDLSEPITIYTRYMDALLIKHPEHPAFFRDLKAFRCQLHIMTLLINPDAASFDTKEMYLAVTRSFLGSRFAHPWCRTSQLKEGWSLAEWGSIKKQSEAKQREEQRLHKLLLPIWCGFRVRMMPSDEVLAQWIDKERTENERKHVATDAKIGSGLDDSKGLGVSGTEAAARSTTAPSSPSTHFPGGGSVPVNAEAYCMELDNGEMDVADKNNDAEAAANLFVGIAATGFLASNKRARKYLMKKLNKK